MLFFSIPFDIDIKQNKVYFNFLARWCLLVLNKSARLRLVHQSKSIIWRVNDGLKTTISPPRKKAPAWVPFGGGENGISLSGLPQNSPLDYFSLLANTQTNLQAPIQIPFSQFFYAKRAPKGALCHSEALAYKIE